MSKVLYSLNSFELKGIGTVETILCEKHFPKPSMQTNDFVFSFSP